MRNAPRVIPERWLPSRRRLGPSSETLNPCPETRDGLEARRIALVGQTRRCQVGRQPAVGVLKSEALAFEEHRAERAIVAFVGSRQSVVAASM